MKEMGNLKYESTGHFVMYIGHLMLLG